MPDFSKRSEELELMDREDLPPADLFQILRELDFINRYLGGHKVTVDAISHLSKKHHPITLLDVGSGGGDTLRTILDWCGKNNIPATGVGVDLNPVMTNFATGQSASYPGLSFVSSDIFLYHPVAEKPDVVTCSLCCHHFPDHLLVKLFAHLYDLCNHAIVVNDLHRHWLAYYSIKWLTGLFSRSYMVKNDAPQSVLRGFVRKDLQNVLAAAGIKHYSLKWKWAFRWQLIIYKP